MDSFVLIILGITSNLAKLKLIPALYDLEAAHLLPEDMTIIGVARSPKSKNEIEEYIKNALQQKNRHHNHPIDEDISTRLAKRVHYVNGDLDDPSFYIRLKENLDDMARNNNSCSKRMFYLATFPSLYKTIFENLKEAKLSTNCGWVRLMIEKPIGTNKESAQALNQLLARYFEEDQIYRLDHYLGKETMQNILAFRFANGLFEHMMNSEYIDHIQVTAAEDFGVGERGGYYDTVGALKDVGQNHLLQMLTFATMDKPESWSNEAITLRRTELLQSIKPDPLSIIFGQYQGYREETNTTNDSETDTFFSFKASIENERFSGVPIYFRGGKELAQTVTEVSIIFKPSPDRISNGLGGAMDPNVLIYRIQPNEGIVLRLLTKKQQHELEIEHTYMQFCYKDYSLNAPDPYERLIMDAFKGDQTFFVDAPEVEAQWEITDKLSLSKTPPTVYTKGTWGPQTADETINADGRQWLEPSLLFCKL